MRIMVFMTNEQEIVHQTVAIEVEAHPLSFRPLLWLLCASAYVWATASAQADLAPFAAPLHRQGLAAMTSTLSVLHGAETLYPALGVLAAVASTYILRRRRAAQMEAVAAADR